MLLFVSCIDNITVEDKETIGPIGISKIREKMPPAIVDYETIHLMQDKSGESHGNNRD